MTDKRFTISSESNQNIWDNEEHCYYSSIDAERLCKLLNELNEENEQLKQQLAHHTRMHEWFRNEAYLLQNKLDNREDEIRRLKGDVE